MKKTKDLLLVLLLATAGCATLQRHGLIDPEDLVTICADARTTCKVISPMDLRARMACDQIIPICDLATPASPSGAFVE